MTLKLSAQSKYKGLVIQVGVLYIFTRADLGFCERGFFFKEIDQLNAQTYFFLIKSLMIAYIEFSKISIRVECTGITLLMIAYIEFSETFILVKCLG